MSGILVGTPVESRRSLALLIGMSDYQHGRKLKSAVNDANDMESKLKSIGFITGGAKLNLTRQELKDVLDKFKSSIRPGDIILVYFAGHGTQWQEVNYLIPIDDQGISCSNITDRAINAHNELMEIHAKKPFIVIFLLDCCRTYDSSNPHEHGLANMEHSESLIAFACKAGTVANDALDNHNGLFTKCLLQHFIKPNQNIQNLLNDVTKEVINESNSAQIPFQSLSISKQHVYLYVQPEEWETIRKDYVSDTYVNISTLLHAHTTMFLKLISCDQLEFLPSVLLDMQEYMSEKSSVDLNGSLDKAFNTVVDEKLTESIIFGRINRQQSLKPYIIDSLKRHHALADIHSILPQCMDFNHVCTSTCRYEKFLDILDTITTRTLLVTTIECLSLESQRYFGTFIRKNDLPIPLSYYIGDSADTSFYKVNFNCLIDVLCLSTDRVCIQVGSEHCVGLSKTSMIPYIFHDKRKESLFNKNEDSTYRSACIDVIFGSAKNSSYVIFDVHGSVNDERNLSLIYAIQLYATIQVLFITPHDLENDRYFLKTMMRTTVHVPTIVCIFDENFNHTASRTHQNGALIKQFQTCIDENKCAKDIKCTLVPKLASIINLGDIEVKRRATKLVQEFANLLAELESSMEKRPLFRSIFAIQSAYIINRLNTQDSIQTRAIRFEIEDKLQQLFGHLSDKTENLKTVTPITYFRSQNDLIKKHLDKIADKSDESNKLRKQRKEIETECGKCETLNHYAKFMINLLLHQPYTSLVIVEQYLHIWRSKYIPELKSKKEEIKKKIAKCENKQLDEENKTSQLTHSTVKKVHPDLKILREKIKDIDAHLANVDLTISLMTDELFALYDHLRKKHPSSFEIYEKEFNQVADKLAQLVHIGFAIHILRNRPLLYQSGLMKICFKRLRTTEDNSLGVLTVIGEQSSAKSSLLNTTFGCNFRVSAGRCTIEMYLGIVYYKTMTIVILDTEGLLSLEESGSIFDNQMVTMAVLSSHIVLINHKGELSSNLEGLIGMSLFAKLQMQSAPLKPKLMFVLRDQMDRKKDVFAEQLTKLRDNLRKTSQFLNVSIDDELEIEEKNLFLLPSAFSEDMNIELNLTQNWRNQTFPITIHELRSQIFRELDEQIKINHCGYTDFDSFYEKIGVNWKLIDELGQGLLECRTLYQLKVINELKDIAKRIIIDQSEELLTKGRKTLEDLLKNGQNQTQLVPDIYLKNVITQGIQSLETLTNDFVRRADDEFQSHTQQAHFTEFKDNIRKNIELSIRCNQQILREQFEENVYTAARENATSKVQNQLLESAQNFFERETSNCDVDINELNRALQLKHEELKIEFEKSIDSMRKTQQDITETLLRNYNRLVQSRQGSAKIKDIYNRCPILFPDSYNSRSTMLAGIWQLIDNYRLPKKEEPSGLSRLFTCSNSQECIVLEDLQWFADHHAERLNREILQYIIEYLIPKLNANLTNMLSNIKLSYSDPQTIRDMIDHVDNLMNAQQSRFQNYYRSINLPKITADLIFIALELLIKEALRISEAKHEEMRKALNELEKWTVNIKEQFLFIRDSDQQARKFADNFLDQLVEEILVSYNKKINAEITEKIIRNSHVDPDRIARQAYDSSIASNPPDGDSIMKYVLDINKYYLELALQNVRLSAEHIVSSQIRKLQELLNDSINKAVNVVEHHQCCNVQHVYQSIIQALRPIIPNFRSENLVGISATIQQPVQCRQRFMKINNRFEELRKQIDGRKAEFDKEAINACRGLITQRLGCQLCCPGCGAKCDNTALSHDKHKSAYHIAMAFKGWRRKDNKHPLLQLCYQHWEDSNSLIVGDEKFSPRRKYYEERAPHWLDDLEEKSRSGDMRAMEIPPMNQRRAWMAVRKALVNHYNMKDYPSYDPQYYPDSFISLPADYQPRWANVD